ncbi:unnamed protein product [Rotaria sordida]|uniref:Protein kinase domain-containing protein n=1 Tax=Rotaria sordida TaxID=392033 RepID=A0A818U6V2_9BILA|nr:unnamed protein product [Rotaria sordida]CAF1008229.1 unnamed protein product [Rotaria sordida]CAF1045450.1 unnamed protein product [Rotaria sordida]CAF1102367.1 unnamed protein product [Rotaria sordida]CAF1173873.1 unnamed protein product [Rotaria sordida]
MNNSLSLTNAKHDPKGLKNPKLTNQGQQLPTKSKLYSSNGAKNYSINIDAQQPLLQLGFRINEKLIGTGSYAKVKRCIREIDNKEFAVKIIDRDKAPADFVSKFLPRELDIIRTLDHPNIIKVQHILETKSLTLIIMEYASNGDLLDYINKTTRLQESVARRMFRELCDAIYYIHFRNICHRDLKCENLLLDNHLRIKLADFGFSRYCVDPSPTDNKKNIFEKKILSRTFCGSAAYAAPEILRGQEYNPKLYDIWSAGCILYIMIYSKMPFDDSDIKKMIEAQMTKGGLRLGSEGSSEVQDLIIRMLQPEVTQRWPIELVQRHPWFTRQINADNQGSSISYVNTTTTNRGQAQGGVHQISKRQGSPIYA